MTNYLKVTRKLQKFFYSIDAKDYSLSNNNIFDELEILPKIDNKKILELISKYPDYKYTELTKILQQKFKIKNIIFGSGSEELIIRINSILKRNRGLGILYPNFYRIMETAGPHKKIYTSYKKNSKFLDIEPIEKQIDKNITSLWISNPNPMIGKVFRNKDMVKMIKKYSNILFIVDEVTIDFIEDSDSFSVLKLSQKVKNLIVIKSFSKFYGLAGLRIGFATGQASILNEIKNIGLTFPITGIAEYFAKNILTKENLFSQISKKIEDHKLSAKNLLSQDPNIIFSESITNCLFFKSLKQDVFTELLKFGIISLKLNGNEGIKEKDFVRITIHSSENLFSDLFSALFKFINSKK